MMLHVTLQTLENKLVWNTAKGATVSAGYLLPLSSC